jgi:hypothetical protein
MADKATELLIADLLALPDGSAVRTILARARKGRYNDYAESGYDMPKVELVKHARAAGLDSIAQGAMDGRYDQGKGEDSEAWAEKEYAENPEMRKIMSALGIAPKSKVN